MAPSLAARLGLGNGRAVANAEQEAQRRRADDRIIAELVASLLRHGLLERPGTVDSDDGAPRGDISSAA